MVKEKSPWTKKQARKPVFKGGPLIWVLLLLCTGLLVFAMHTAFPEPVFSDRDNSIALVRLIAVLALVSSGLVFMRTIQLGETIRNLSIWTSLAALLLVGYTFKEELGSVANRLKGELIPGTAVKIRENEFAITASTDGHFYINGTAEGSVIRFMIDTGATDIVISPQAAKKIGIDLQSLTYSLQYQTANGTGFGAPYWLKNLTIGPFNYKTAKISVNKAEMVSSLLGMSFLNQLKSFEFRGKKLYLRK